WYRPQPERRPALGLYHRLRAGGRLLERRDDVVLPHREADAIRSSRRRGFADHQRRLDCFSFVIPALSRDPASSFLPPHLPVLQKGSGIPAQGRDDGKERALSTTRDLPRDFIALGDRDLQIAWRGGVADEMRLAAAGAERFVDVAHRLVRH